MRLDGVAGTKRGRLLVAVAVAVVFGGCAGEADWPLPSTDEVAAYYSYEGRLEVGFSGNVAQIVVTQPASQLRRGGPLWAKVGPYVVLFSDETFQLLEDHPGVGGVRVITKVANGPEVARAMLRRDEFTGVLWRRTLNIAGKARRDGTNRPALLEDLVQWGEDHTEFEYNPRYTRSR